MRVLAMSLLPLHRCRARIRVAPAAFVALAACAVFAVPRAAAAQVPADTISADSIFIRAQQLVQSGNAAQGRILVDSVLAARSPDSLSYADALYWRAALAPNNVDAERDYLRITVDYPLSERSADALLQLASIEQLRGDNDAAAAHLHRFLLENPTHPERGRASYELAQILLAQNDMQRGCRELAHAQRAVPDSLVELRNRIAFDAQRCVGVDTTVAVSTSPKAVTRATARSARADRAASAESRSESAEASAGRFTFQVGAFPSRSAADALAAKLRKRGMDARVVPGKLNRVQIGRYATRAAATAAAKKLEARGIHGFVTETPAGSAR